MTDFLVPKSSKKFHCINCDYITYRKSQFDRHILTLKHKRLTNTDPILTDLSSNSSTCYFMCNCGKQYKHKQSLFTHRKKCILLKKDNYHHKNNDVIINNNNDDDNKNLSYKDMFLKVMNENKEMRNIIMKQQEQMIEILPKIGNITNNTTNNTTHNNQKFNINLFLNEQCKDAINISDFIKSIEVSIDQLNFTKDKGLAAGVSKTIIENMSKLSLYERPMHCTDIKRETLYIKDDDKWEKDDNKSKIKNIIKKTSNKNYNALQNWKENNPDFGDDDTKKEYLSHVISTIGKPTEDIDEKVIKNICKQTYVKD